MIATGGLDDVCAISRVVLECRKFWDGLALDGHFASPRQDLLCDAVEHEGAEAKSSKIAYSTVHA
jgi:hypothetical protein